jgi:uncharacterized membrane protein
LVAWLGEGGFRALFSMVAAVSFAVAVNFYATHRLDGPPGPSLGDVPALRWALIGLIVAGVAVVTAGSVTYPGSPYDMFGPPVRPPRGIERITRHPFFVGLGMVAIAHALLATHLIGTIVFGTIALVSLGGARHQDTKLLARRGKPYADYLAATSMLPFVAIVSGRQPLVWREMRMGAFAVGVAIAFGLRAIHDSLFAHGGLWVIVAVVGGAGVFTWQSWRRLQRPGVLAVRRVA